MITIATATTVGDSSGSWYESQLLGVVAGALIAGMISWGLATLASRTADRQAAKQRKFDRAEARREGRKAAYRDFVSEVRHAHDFSKRHEKEFGMRYGDQHPEEYERHPQVEEALATLALEVPKHLYAHAVLLRDVLDVHIWEWDATSKKSRHVTDEDIEEAEVLLREAMRRWLAAEDVD